MSAPRVLVLGLGNVLLRDEGLGVSVDRLLVVDAVRLGGAPGEAVRLDGEAVPAALDLKMSTHEIGLKDLLAAARLLGRTPAEVVLRGIEAGVLAPGTGFSAPVAAALPHLLAGVLDELRRWGLAPRAVATPGPPPPWWQPAGVAR